MGFPITCYAQTDASKPVCMDLVLALFFTIVNDKLAAIASPAASVLPVPTGIIRGLDF